MIEMPEDNLVEVERGADRDEIPASEETVAARMPQKLTGSPPRPAWIEVDLKRLERNFELIAQDKPNGVELLSVVKDEAYSHGAFQVAKAALASGATFLGLSTLQEAIALRERGIKAPMLI